MNSSEAFESIQPITDAINNAPTPFAAALALADWFDTHSTPCVMALLHADDVTLSTIASASLNADDSMARWMHAEPEWRAWRAPRKSGESEWLVPLVYGERAYGLLSVHGDLTDSAFLLASLLAARLHHVWGAAAWRATLEGINEITLSLNRVAGEDGWDRVFDQLNVLFDATSLYVGLYDVEHGRVRLPLAGEDGLRVMWEPVPICGLNAAVLTFGMPLLFHDLDAESERIAKLSAERCDDEPGLWARSWIGVPMRNRNHEIIGLISLHNILPNSFDDDDLMLLMAISAQIALALDNALLLQAERERRTVASTLMDVGQIVSSTLHFEEVLDVILEQLQRVVDYDSATLLLPAAGSDDGTRMVICAVQGPNVDLRGKELHFRANSPSMLVYASKQPLVLANALEHPGWVPGPIPDEPAVPRSWIGAPMIVQDRVIGVITLAKFAAGYYTERDASTAFALARQAAIAVENARLHAQQQANLRALQERTNRLTLMHRMAALITSTLDYDTVLSSAAQSLTELFDIDHSAIALLDEHNGAVRVIAEYPDGGNTGYELAVEGSSALERLASHVGGLIVNETEDSGDGIMRVLMERIGAASALVLPLSVRERVFGLLAVSTVDPEHRFSNDERDTFESMAGQVALAVHNADLYQQAVAANRLKSQFLATISHELRTPLNAIIGYSDMLLDEIYGALTERQRDRIQRVNNSGRHLLALINDVLDLSKIEAGQMSLESAPMFLSDLLPGVLSEIRPAAEGKGLALHTYIHPNEQRIVGDAERLRQILLNLLHNAVKFTPHGEISVAITPYIQRNGIGVGSIAAPTRTTVADGDYVALTVKDTGIGIQPDHHELIFEAFRQVDGSSARQYGGSGLGLAITRQLASLHNGHVWVESSLGEGSTFTVLLPCAVSNLDTLGALQQDGRPLLLVVDNDRSALQLVKDYLGDGEFEVVGLRSPNQAIELARRLQPAAIITDLMMPEMTGWDLLRALKADAATESIPVIVLSIMDEKARGFFLGAADYLTKPIDRAGLLESLARVVHTPSADPILIVDDSADDSNLLREWLSRGGYAVEVVPSGEAALHWLSRQPAALILLDLMLPGMSGFDLLTMLRRDTFTGDIPVIVVTAQRLSDNAASALEADLATVLQKSTISGTTLLEQVHDAINSRRGRVRTRGR